MKQLLPSILSLAFLLSASGCQKEPDSVSLSATGMEATEDRATVFVIPANSHNALASALQSHSFIVLAAGLHTEDNGVVVTGYKRIVGQDGAILSVSTTPFTDPTVPIQAALHFKNASNSSLENVSIQSATAIGGTAVLVENAQKVTIQRCNMNGFQYGILVEKSPRVSINRNVIQTNPAWQTGEIGEAHGIVIVNGEGARIEDNEISGAFFGCWACDKNGIYRRNYTHDNYLGLILCKVPTPALLLPGGIWTGAQFSASNWKAQNNRSSNNLTTGYLVIDGANNNFLENNEAGSNGTYDYELAGDSYRFGFLTPFCFDNTLHAKAGQTVKNCGTNNTVIGGSWVDLGLDPCN